MSIKTFKNFDTLLQELDITYSWDILEGDKEPIDIIGVLHLCGMGGNINSILGDSGSGKTKFGTLLMQIYANLGYNVITNYAIADKNSRIKRVTQLSDLSIELAELPLYICNCGYEYRYYTKEKPKGEYCPICNMKLKTQRTVIFIDEGNLTASYTNKGNKTELFKAWAMNFMRKSAGTENSGACLFIVFQHEGQGATLFRSEGVLFGEFQKTGHKTMTIDFPRKKTQYGFPIPLNKLPIAIDDIPLPNLNVYSHGISSFLIDMDSFDLDGYLAIHGKDDPSPENLKRLMVKFVKENNLKNKIDLSKLSKDEREEMFDKYDFTVYEKLLLINKWIGLDELKIKGKELAQMFGVSPASITQEKSKLRERVK